MKGHQTGAQAGHAGVVDVFNGNALCEERGSPSSLSSLLMASLHTTSSKALLQLKSFMSSCVN
jgi:hypothetical protein